MPSKISCRSAKCADLADNTASDTGSAAQDSQQTVLQMVSARRPALGLSCYCSPASHWRGLQPTRRRKARASAEVLS